MISTDRPCTLVVSLDPRESVDYEPHCSSLLDNVSPGTYLVTFSLFPSEIEGEEWGGIAVTETPLGATDMDTPASGEPDFWQSGGPAIALANWNHVEGMTVTTGNVCSNEVSFCFSLREGRLEPVVAVGSNETVEVDLVASFQPEDYKRG
jgi:hypothetical protein